MLDELDLNIIELLKNSEHPISSTQIAKSQNKSSRTIRDRIKRINNEMMHHGAQIEMIPGLGIALIETNKEQFNQHLVALTGKDNHFSDFISSEVRNLIYLLVAKNDFIKSDDICDQLWMSRSKLSTVLYELRNILLKYDLEIQSKPYFGIKLCGTEFNQRRFIASHYVQDSWFYTDDHNNEKVMQLAEASEHQHNVLLTHTIESIVLEELEVHNYNMSNVVFKSLVTHLLVTTLRLHGDQCASLQDDIAVQDETSLEYRLSRTILQRMEKKLLVQFPMYEYSYIAMHIVSKKVLEVSDYVSISPEINLLVEEFLQQIKCEKNIDLLENLDLRMMLALHISPLLKRIEYGLELKNPILNDVKIQCVAGYDLAIGCCQIINERYHTTLSDHEVSYIAMHFDVALFKQSKQVDKRNILIVCASGRASAELLRMKFESLFERHIKNIYVCDINEIEQWTSKKEIDYIFTTIPITSQLHLLSPVFEFSFLLDDVSVKKIKSILSGENNRNDLTQYFSKELFFSQKVFTTRKEVLDYMIERIVANEIVPSNFRELVWERELFTGTDIIKHVALPHPSQVVSERTFVAVMVLDKPIVWSTKKVKVIFLVSIEKKDSEKYRSLMEKLVEIVTSQKSMQNIFDNPTFHTLMQEVKKSANLNERYKDDNG